MGNHIEDGQRIPKKHRGRKAVLMVLCVLALALATGFMLDVPSRQEVSGLTVGHVDFARLTDGTYEGEFVGTKGHLRDAAVRAWVSDGTLTAVKVLKGAVDDADKPVILNGSQTNNDLFDRVIRAQTLEVDAISGATLTSRAHLKALENALEGAPIQ